MDTPPRNYNPLEPVIHLINRNFITISPEEKDIYSSVLESVLKKYHEFLERKELPYYWNSKCDLLGKIDETTLINMSNKIKSIILDIERHLDDDPFVVAKYLVTSQEVWQLKTQAENLAERRISF